MAGSENPQSIPQEEGAKAAEQGNTTTIAEHVASLPEGVIPRPEEIEVPQHLQPASGLKGAVVNGRRERKAAAYTQGFVEGRTQASIVDPDKLNGEMSTEGSTGSAIHLSRVEGHAAGYNTLPPRTPEV